jgi:hypothetical protein
MTWSLFGRKFMAKGKVITIDAVRSGAHEGRLRNEEVDRNWVGPVAASEVKRTRTLHGRTE